MKVIKLSLVMALSVATATLSAQVFIDGENASIDKSGNLKDNGRTLIVKKEGPGVITPWITGFSRKGGKGVGYRLNGANSGTKQRIEHHIINWRNPQNIGDGANRYTGFSVFLSNDVWASPTSWFLIHQIQQVAVGGQQGNFPFIALELTGGNNMRIVTRSGQNGNTVRNPSQSVKTKWVRTLQQGRWYDIVVGWRFRPNNNDGWVNVWHKQSNENKYQQAGIGKIKVGYWQPQKKILNNKVGMYRGRVTGSNKLYFDEVRWAGFFDGAKIPGSFKKELTNQSEFDSSEPLPANLILSQNPLEKSEVTLNIKSSISAHTNVEVFNTLGQKLSDFDAGEIEQGNNELDFNLRTLNINAPGMYLLRINTGEGIQTKKIVIE